MLCWQCIKLSFGRIPPSFYFICIQHLFNSEALPFPALRLSCTLQLVQLAAFPHNLPVGFQQLQKYWCNYRLEIRILIHNSVALVLQEGSLAQNQVLVAIRYLQRKQYMHCDPKEVVNLPYRNPIKWGRIYSEITPASLEWKQKVT